MLRRRRKMTDGERKAHRIKARLRYRNLSPEKRAEIIEKQKRRIAAASRDGRCVCCGQPKEPERSQFMRCEKCNDRNNRNQRKKNGFKKWNPLKRIGRPPMTLQKGLIAKPQREVFNGIGQGFHYRHGE